MSRSAKVWLTLLTLGLLTGVVLVALRFERVTEEVDVGFRGEARRNPALATVAAGLFVALTVGLAVSLHYDESALSVSWPP